MIIKKHPEFVHLEIDKEGVRVDLEYRTHCFAHFEVRFADVYENSKKYKLDFGDMYEHYLSYITQTIIKESEKFMNEAPEILMNKKDKKPIEIDWGKSKGYKEMLEMIGHGYETYYQPYWTIRKEEEIINDIINYYTTLVWFYSIDVKGADKLVLKKKKTSPIIKMHLEDETSRFDETIFYAMMDKISDLVFSLGLLKGKEYNIEKLNKFIDSGCELKNESEYIDWENKLCNALRK